MTKWNEILGNENMRRATIDFATEYISGEDFKSIATQFRVGGIARNLIRERGVHNSRNVARKALRRRSLLV